VEDLSGYRGHALDLLHKAGARIGDLVKVNVKRGGTTESVEGLLMPRYQTGGDESYVVLKLKTGYNVGVRVDRLTEITVLGKGAQPRFTRPPAPQRGQELPRVTIVSTGGTIASKVDYRTGAVEPVLDAEDLYSVVPELAEVAEIDARILLNIFSENIGPHHWRIIAESIGEEVRRSVDGVVIAHGTDTLGYTAAALSFALKGIPIPVVLVGAQRSSDRPSSDAATNLLAATAIAARAPFAEVVVAMHDWISDEKIAVHRGTRVRKCHTSRRDAFKTINAQPIAYYDLTQRALTLTSEEYGNRRKEDGWVVRPEFDPNVLLVKFHPGLSVGMIDWAIASGYKGIVLEGTGLGHVSETLFPALERATSSGIVVGMCSQCIWGRVHMNVYSAGRDLQRIGVLNFGDMLAETALVKMMWAFGQEKRPEKVKEIMLTNMVGEFSDRRLAEVEE